MPEVQLERLWTDPTGHFEETAEEDFPHYVQEGEDSLRGARDNTSVHVTESARACGYYSSCAAGTV